MADRLYPQLSHEQVLALEPHYSRHVAAMTEEGLFGKAEIAEQLALRDMKISMLEAEVLYPVDRLTEWLKNMGLTLEFQASPDVPGYTAAIFRGVVEVAMHRHLDWQEAIRGVIRKVGLSLPTNTLLDVAHRRIAALEYMLGLAVGENVGLSPVKVAKGLTHLESLFQEAIAKVNAMSPEERDAMFKAQRESWARGQVGLIPSDRAYSESRGIDGD